jgi:hypothetical protein
MIGGIEGSRRIAPLILNLAARLCSAVNNTPRPLYLGEETGGWAPEPVCTDVEKRKSLVPTGFKTPDRLSRNESFSRPHYPCPIIYTDFGTHCSFNISFNTGNLLDLATFLSIFITYYLFFQLRTFRVIVSKVPPVFLGSNIT